VAPCVLLRAPPDSTGTAQWASIDDRQFAEAQELAARSAKRKGNP
jgi:hypothetical protein